MSNILTSIDLGTSKVCVVVAELDAHGRTQVLGIGRSNCRGIKKGVVVDIEETTNAIMEAISQAENMSNADITKATINLPGGYCKLVRNKGIIAVSGEDKEITYDDVKRVLNSATIVSIPQDQQLIDVIPTQYVVDGYDEIMDPIGMTGIRLEVDADIITGSSTTVLNLIKAINRAGIEVVGIIMEPLATAEAVLNADAKDMGVLLLDVGAGTTDYTFFKNGKIQYSSIVPVGGSHITADISTVFRVPTEIGEEIKVRYGSLSEENTKTKDEFFEAVQLGSSEPIQFSVEELQEVIEFRVREIFSIVSQDLQKKGIANSLIAGVVLTGGGLSYLEGIKELASEMFNANVQIGSPNVMGANEPVYSVAVGIIKYSLKRKNSYYIEYNNIDAGQGHKSSEAPPTKVKQKQPKAEKAPKKKEKVEDENSFASKMKKFFKEYF